MHSFFFESVYYDYYGDCQIELQKSDNISVGGIDVLGCQITCKIMFILFHSKMKNVSNGRFQISKNAYESC